MLRLGLPQPYRRRVLPTPQPTQQQSQQQPHPTASLHMSMVGRLNFSVGCSSCGH